MDRCVGKFLFPSEEGQYFQVAFWDRMLIVRNICQEIIYRGLQMGCLIKFYDFPQFVIV